MQTITSQRLRQHLDQITTSTVRSAYLREDANGTTLVLPNILAGQHWSPEVFDVEIPLPTNYPAVAPRCFLIPAGASWRNVPAATTTDAYQEQNADWLRVPFALPKWSATNSTFQTLLTAIRRYLAQP